MCTADELDRFIGQPATAEVGQEILRSSGARIFRWLPKGTIITMEYNGNRVNAELDERNRISGVRCG